MLAACTSGSSPPAVSHAFVVAPSEGQPTPPASPLPSTPVVAATLPPAARQAVAHPTTWLCRPLMTGNPCEDGLDATVVRADGGTANDLFAPDDKAPVDCFYVYPTVSRAPGTNAPLAGDDNIVAAARAQAARFGGVCRLFVPVYRQVTIAALFSGTFFDPAATRLADADVRSAWHDYLNRDNGGRGIVLIGHSQGAMALTRLLAAEVDSRPDMRRRIVSAVLLGGNVTTATGKDSGGSFRSLPVCRRRGQYGCVVAYSSYSQQPPATSYFGRAGDGRQVVCVDPSRLAGHDGALTPYLPTTHLAAAGTLTGAVSGPYATGFVTYPGYLRAQCRTAGGATWLDVQATPGGTRPALDTPLGPDWGLHLGDVNLALGDLVEVVRQQAAAWSAAVLH